MEYFIFMLNGSAQTLFSDLRDSRDVKKAYSFIKAEDCNQRIPQMVIAFYQGRLKFILPEDTK